VHCDYRALFLPPMLPPELLLEAWRPEEFTLSHLQVTSLELGGEVRKRLLRLLMP
jgi:hypothetical protein